MYYKYWIEPPSTWRIVSYDWAGGRMELLEWREPQAVAYDDPVEDVPLDQMVNQSHAYPTLDDYLTAQFETSFPLSLEAETVLQDLDGNDVELPTAFYLVYAKALSYKFGGMRRAQPAILDYRTTPNRTQQDALDYAFSKGIAPPPDSGFRGYITPEVIGPYNGKKVFDFREYGGYIYPYYRSARTWTQWQDPTIPGFWGHRIETGEWSYLDRLRVEPGFLNALEFSVDPTSFCAATYGIGSTDSAALLPYRAESGVTSTGYHTVGNDTWAKTREAYLCHKYVHRRAVVKEHDTPEDVLEYGNCGQGYENPDHFALARIGPYPGVETTINTTITPYYARALIRGDHPDVDGTYHNWFPYDDLKNDSGNGPAMPMFLLSLLALSSLGGGACGAARKRRRHYE